jgi:hypothetical protein
MQQGKITDDDEKRADFVPSRLVVFLISTRLIGFVVTDQKYSERQHVTPPPPPHPTPNKQKKQKKEKNARLI